MPAAVRAMVFGAFHEQAAIALGFEGIVNARKETGPARSAVKFHVGLEEGLAASGADKGALAMLVVQRAGETSLSAFLAQHVILLRRQTCAPLLVGFVNSCHEEAFANRPRRAPRAAVRPP